MSTAARADHPPSATTQFDYGTAFVRNIGWVTPAEQQILRYRRVAVAGVGGVGCQHVLTLTRLGVGRFHIADPDVFELANFNRQAGATLQSIGRPKVDVVADMALDINPELDIRKFPGGVTEDNLGEFLEGADLYVDGLDFFALGPRREVFRACRKAGIPAVTAAPLGTGSAVLNFMPGRMSFEEYFRLEGQSEDEQLLRFLMGLSPAMLQRPYLVHPSAVDLAAHCGPSTPMACDICAGMAATQALKILLRRGKVPAAPWGLQFDPYRNRLARTWRPGGNAHPLQRLGLRIARHQLARFRSQPPQPGPGEASGRRSVPEQILDLARWAPSGDNTQPWRFAIRAERHVVVRGFDTRAHCVYDLDGRVSQMAFGALLETLRRAARCSAFGSRRPGAGSGSSSSRRRSSSPATCARTRAFQSMRRAGVSPTGSPAGSGGCSRPRSSSARCGWGASARLPLERLMEG